MVQRGQAARLTGVKRPGAEPQPLDFRLLGPVEVWSLGRRVDLGPAESAKARCVLSVLLRNPGVPVSTDALVERVWGDRPAGAAARYKYVGWVRSALAPHGVALVQDDRGYRLGIDAQAVDLHRFRRAVAEARDLVGHGRLSEASAVVESGLRLWRGPALDGLSGPWPLLFRDQIARERRAAAILRFQVEMTLGHDAEVLGELAEWVTENPTDESFIGLHVLALHRTGQPAAAVACYDRAVTRIRDALQTAPGPELCRLHRRIRDPDPSLLTDPVLAGYRGSANGAIARPPQPATVDSTAPGSAPRQLPAQARSFVGRADELALLDSALSTPDGHGPVTVAIGGTAGVGKTTLAVYWAHRVADRFPDGQLYANLRGFDPSGTPVPPADVLRGFLDALGLEPSGLPAGVDALSARFRSLLAGRRVLVVLDNARDVAQVRPLVPGGAGCCTLVTSRTATAGLVAAEGAIPIALDLLDPAAARDLLCRRLGPERVASDPAALDQLIGECAGLPLALSIVAGRAATHRQLPLDALATQLSVASRRLDTLDSGDDFASVRAVFSWSYRCLSAPAARLFRLLSLPKGADIAGPAAASLAGLPVELVDPLLDELTTAQLLTERTVRRFSFHDLLREYARELCRAEESDADREAAVLRLLDHYLHTAHAAAKAVNLARPRLDLPPVPTGVAPQQLTDRSTAWSWFEAEHPMLLALVAHAAEHGLDSYAWRLPWCLADFYHQRGYWHDWAATQSTALAAATRLGDPAAQAVCHQYLGYALGRLHRARAANASLGRALRLYQRLGDQAGEASTHMMKAITFEQQSRLAEALTHATEAVRLRRVIGQPAALANALNAVGWYSALNGEGGQAIPYCEEALLLHRDLGNLNGEAATVDSLGYAQYHCGQYERAIASFEYAIELNQRLGDRYNLALNLVHLGDAHAATGASEVATATWRRALAVLDELGHPDAALVRRKLHSGGGRK